MEIFNASNRTYFEGKKSSGALFKVEFRISVNIKLILNFKKNVYMILKIYNVSIRCIIFKNSARCLISANSLSEQNQHGKDKYQIKTLCFLTICFDVNCSCANPKKDSCTSTDRNETLTTSDVSLSCMIFNRRINEGNIERNTTQTEDVKNDNVSCANEAFTQKGGMPRFIIG